MKSDDVKALYRVYAKDYNELWHLGGEWAGETGHHLDTLRSLIGPDTRWLDVGCGSGFYLSQFPGVVRGGLDLTPEMLAEAASGSPDAEVFRQGDMRDDVEEWHDSWDLVTSTGQAWTYVDTVGEVHTVADNMARWTAPGGKVFVQVVDLLDFADATLPYNWTGERAPYETFVSGTVWSTWDGEKIHEDMIAPSLDLWVQWFSKHFKRIEIIRWPHWPAVVRVPRRSILASEKRAAGDDGPTVVIEHPVPGTQPEPDGDVGSDGNPEPGTTTLRSLYDQPLSSLVETYAPWKPRVWRALRRRLP